MSEFLGKLLEYPFISIDRFNRANFSSTMYFLSHFHKDHIEGLDSSAFTDRLKEGQPQTKLYVSDTTLSLMKCDYLMRDILPYSVGLPVNQPISLEIKCGSEHKHLTVTLISAGHCVGSVMFLFEGDKGTVLYTGDFRLGKSEISKVKCLHAGQVVRHIDSMYVDTTFCCPGVPHLPSRKETKDGICHLISKWIQRGPHYMVHLKCKGKYGYEYIMKGVAKHFATKIHVNPWRVRMFEKLIDMLQYFTTDRESTQIHCCYNPTKESETCLPCGLASTDGKNIKLLTIVPSSLWFVRNGIPSR